MATETIEVEAPALALLSPGTAASFALPDSIPLCREGMILFDPPERFLPFLSLPVAGSGLMVLSLAGTPQWDEIYSAFQGAVRSYHDGIFPEHEALALNGLERALLLSSMVHRSLAGGEVDLRIRGTVEHMRRAMAEKITVAQLADRVHLSSGRFAHLFREALEVSPMVYLEQLRLTTADHLLHTTDLSIEEVGHKVGFPNRFHFSTRFRKHFGHPPSAARQSQQDSLEG
ncbi:MAG: helix-turn-helix domain-containing protein [Planctomycetota bacterium]